MCFFYFFLSFLFPPHPKTKNIFYVKDFFQVKALDLNIENVQLNIDTAIPLGLLINEVLTNSLKYGIPGMEAGAIFIDLQSIREDADNGSTMYQLRIGDNGVGYDDDINHLTTKS